VLAFSDVAKAGFVFGGSYGEGQLTQGSKIDRYYNLPTGSQGFQAGIRCYGYVVFLMTKRALSYWHRTDQG